ncbi:putative 40S ribosomal protein S27-1 [Monocercomonoides exilis]|uniref:putative 40S ribosomal protein S27-1 n=1 Tax=Monocercomonoides exilis TaxID=2049356 RepID=UPI003559F59A|nr:putative 40S ribosomal protein S27-1 [Monocercomonoides exilis]|eukprot:MONOS_2471.1-p1 / transcript=MONOS_2471.1 / gene=MONOS_2471 / organism=Monocercomonoides_exilis_PA203 / gene_product=40S ribosomal protein S27-1 / transcript_product=40S ribosomal protein S27-1 / location=Mono_scaffold00051:94644-95127(+) / protein_length=89 / sequence_SO=supercontig / SO=protein_coding / is_pseudo=false
MVKKYQFKVDLLHPSKKSERQSYKLKRLVQSPNSYFMDVKCHNCQKIMTVFSHATSTVVCGNCANVICTPTGGKARLTTGVRYRRKAK